MKKNNILYSGLGGCSDVCNVGKIDDHIETLSFILVGPKRYINYVSKKIKVVFCKNLSIYILFIFISCRY